MSKWLPWLSKRVVDPRLARGLAKSRVRVLNRDVVLTPDKAVGFSFLASLATLACITLGQIFVSNLKIKSFLVLYTGHFSVWRLPGMSTQKLERRSSRKPRRGNRKQTLELDWRERVHFSWRVSRHRATSTGPWLQRLTLSSRPGADPIGFPTRGGSPWEKDRVCAVGPRRRVLYCPPRPFFVYVQIPDHKQGAVWALTAKQRRDSLK